MQVAYLNTHFIRFTLLKGHLTLQKVRPVFLDVLPCACFVQHSSKESNDLKEYQRERELEFERQSCKEKMQTFKLF